ncbi:MAG: CPBP family intramembrane glutamic endopeptidase [Myxococcota bacterium]
MTAETSPEALAAPHAAPASRWIELLALYLVAPAAYAAWGLEIVRPIPIVIGASLAAWWTLRRDPSFDRGELWRWSAVREAFPGIALRVLAGGLALVGLVLVTAPESFLDFPRQRPLLWAFVMVAYPIFSVYAQELLWRTFFFHRYAPILSERALWIASGLLFGFMHVVFRHWIAVAATLVGGLFFAWSYRRHRSLAAVCVEHALFGCLLFTIGLGTYFYSGAAALR